MKKLVFALLLALTLSLSLFSCKIIPFGGGGVEDPPVEEVENLIFNKDTEFYVVYNPEEFEEYEINSIIDALFNLGLEPRAISPDEPAKEHEIVIGKVAREISNVAYQRIERMDKNSDEDGRYVIYSDGSSVAIAYDYEYGNFTRKIALDYFKANYITEELILEPGEAHKEQFNLPEYLGELDQAYYAQCWQNIEDTLGEDGKDVVAAFKSYYQLYDGEAILRWLVNLLDQNICICHALDGEMECKKTKYCGGAGFYYATSARNNIGFAPDAESCAQALSIIGNCGITRGLRGGGYASVLPEEIGQKICDYLSSLQEKDGFFYHPQWERSSTTLNRRGRDYSWCTGILHTYGRPLNYKKPTAYEFDSESALPGMLGNSSVVAVSKVIAANEEDTSPHLATLEAFKEYIASLDIANNSYPAGNTLSAQSSQIQAKGREYEQVVFDELDRVYKMYDNGTFHHTVNVYAINGVMKCIGWYERMGQPIPDAYKTAMACFEGIGTEEPIKDIVDIWNPWVAFNRVMSNIETCTPNGKEVVAELKADLYLEYAEAITDTRDKLITFRKDDGSFSYMKDRTSTTSQGMHVSMANVNEGDVNATVIGTNNFTYELFTLVEPMGLGRVPFAGLKERYIFYQLLEANKPVIKEGTNADIGEPLDFDYDDVGYAPNGVAFKADASESEDGRGISVVEDMREGRDGNVMKYTSLPGVADEFSLKAMGLFKGATRQVFEGEFCFEKANGSRLIRFEFGNGSDNSNNYRVQLMVSGNTIKLQETSGRDSYKKLERDLGISVQKGEWFKLRVEYYAGTHDTVRIKVYFNDKLAAISDNYYNYNGTKITEGTGKPNNVFEGFRMYMLIDSNAVVYCDNVHVYNDKGTYEVEALHEDFEKDGKGINVDRRLLVEEGLEVGKRMPTKALKEARSEEGSTLSTLDLINKPVLIFHFNNKTRADIAEIDQLLNEINAVSEKMSVYAVHSTESLATLEAFININHSESKIHFLEDTRAEGATVDDYYSLIGGSGADQRIILLNKDGLISYVSDEAFDYDTVKAEIEKLLAN